MFRLLFTQRHSRVAFLAFAVLLLLVTPPAQLLSQEVSAGITGIVNDPSGAAIVGAEITMRDIDRGTSWATQSNAEGTYAFPRIPAGRYELTVKAEGFRTYSQPDILLEVNQRARVDIAMQLGAVTETVEVTGAAPLLQTEKTEIGSVISGTQTVDLPLASRNFIALTLLAPGVTTTNQSVFNNGRRSGGGGRPYVNGNREQANNFLLDGIDNNQVSDNLTSYQPNVDAIGEFKMITNNASAEFGNFQGGIVNVSLKSGTNQLHGSVFEFLQNDKLNANNWARNWRGLDRTAIRQNVFGFSLGGPVMHDKLFFFMDYQGLRRAEPGSAGNFNVIPAEFRQGDFSRLLSENKIQLYDYTTTDANRTRQPFANNAIPLARIDPVAKALFASPDLYPLPINNGLRFNQLNTGSRQLQTNQGDIKLDWKPTEKDDVSARYSKSVQDEPNVNTIPVVFGGFANSPFQAGVINWTRTLGTSMVNEVRVGVNNIMVHNGGTDNGLGDIASKLGIKNGNDRGPGLMALNFTGSNLANNIGSANIGTQTMFANTTYQYIDNLTIIKGRHIMKTGWQVLRQHMNTFYAGNTGRTGFLQYDGLFSRNPSDSSSKGFAEADFFLGAPSRIGRGVAGNIWGHRKYILGGYYQDDWRVNDTLTLNLGLRWEWHQPLYEVLDRQSNFEPYTGKLLLAGKDGNSRALYNAFNKDFQPRIGFAWTPEFLGGHKTVIRGAYTISSFMEGTGTNLRLPINPPFNVEFEAIYDGALQPVSTTGDGFSTVVQTNPYKSANIRLWDTNVRPSNVQQWNFTVERQLPGDTVFSAAYVGQKGTHLVVPMPYFQRVGLDGKPAASSPYLSGNPDLAVISQISGTETNGDQEYNALQVQARRRLSAGFLYQLSYTYSKGMSDAIGFYGGGGQTNSQSAYWQNLRDKRSEWGPTFFDQTHMLTYSYVYELPFGKNQKMGSNWNPVLNGVAGGWQMSGILTLRTGFPWTMRGPDRSGTTSRGYRADRVGDGEGTRDVGPGTAWFDKTAFKDPATGTFGNSGNGVVRGPGYKTFDLSLEKSFSFSESRRLQFRTEFFNLTNTPQFNSGNRDPTSPTFGEITAAQGERTIQFGLRFEF